MAWDVTFSNGCRVVADESANDKVYWKIYSHTGYQLTGYPANAQQFTTSLGRPTTTPTYNKVGDVCTWDMLDGSGRTYQLRIEAVTLDVGARNVQGVSIQYSMDTKGAELINATVKSYVMPGNTKTGTTNLSSSNYLYNKWVRKNYFSTPNNGCMFHGGGSLWHTAGGKVNAFDPVTTSHQWYAFADQAMQYACSSEQADHFLCWTLFDGEGAHYKGSVVFPALWILWDNSSYPLREKQRNLRDAMMHRYNAQTGHVNNWAGDVVHLPCDSVFYNNQTVRTPSGASLLHDVADRYLTPGSGDYIGAYGCKTLYLEPWIVFNHRSSHPCCLEVPSYIGGETGLRYLCNKAHANNLKVIAWTSCTGYVRWGPIWAMHPEWQMLDSNGDYVLSYWYARNAGSLSRGYPSTTQVGSPVFTYGSSPLNAPTSLTLAGSGGGSLSGSYNYAVTTCGTRGDSTPRYGSITVGAGSKVTVSWPYVSGSTGYRVYRQQSGTYYLIGTDTFPAGDIYKGDTLSMVDTGYALNTQYAVNTVNNAYIDVYTYAPWQGFYDYVLERFKYWHLNGEGLDGYYFDSSLVMREGDGYDYYDYFMR